MLYPKHVILGRCLKEQHKINETLPLLYINVESRMTCYYKKQNQHFKMGGKGPVLKFDFQVRRLGNHYFFKFRKHTGY